MPGKLPKATSIHQVYAKEPLGAHCLSVRGDGGEVGSSEEEKVVEEREKVE